MAATTQQDQDNKNAGLRPYQIEDLYSLIHKSAYGVFNQQRTGKTPTSIRATATQGYNKVLMVVPATLLYPWRDEFVKWTGNPCVVYTGTPTQREATLADWTHGLVINYEMLRQMQAKPTRPGEKGRIIKECISDALLKHKPDAIIIDEAHRIKGRTTANAKAVFKLSKVPYRLALTGTPAPNQQYEIWSILHFLFPQTFRSYWAFIDEWFESSQLFLKTGAIRQEGQLKAGKVKDFQEMLSHISIMRKRIDVMPWLPEEDPPTRIRLPLTPSQIKYLRELEEFYETGDLVTVGILDRIMRYRQICNAPHLVGLKGSSPKIEWLKQYVADYPDRPTVVFSRLAGFVRLVGEALPGSKIITGDTSYSERQVLINDFQSGKISILIGQVDCLKEGVTLDRAECLIFLDQCPPASDISQARDRIIATHPDRAMIPKQVIDVMMADSYDEVLYDLVEHNATMTDVINNYKKYLGR